MDTCKKSCRSCLHFEVCKIINTFKNSLKKHQKIFRPSSNKGPIDKMYKLAKNAGATGGKIVGAGGGGFLLVMASFDKCDKIREELRDYKELLFGFEDDGSKVILNIK